MVDTLQEVQECWERVLDDQEKFLFVLHFDRGYTVKDLAKEFSMSKVGMWYKIGRASCRERVFRSV